MLAVFGLTFLLGDAIKGYVEIFIDWLIGISTVGLERLHVSAWLIDLITEGVIGGVGGIITFYQISSSYSWHWLFGRQWIYGTCRVCDE